MRETGLTLAELISELQLGGHREALLCAAIAGLILGYIGVFIVLRRMVFVTAALGQAAGLGIVVASAVGARLGVQADPAVFAIVLTLIVSCLLVPRAERLGVSREAVLGLTYLASWSGAILFGARMPSGADDVAAILFGNAMVSPPNVDLVGSIGGPVLLFYLWFHRPLVFTAYDRQGARVQGLPVELLELLAWTSLALVVAVTTRALGVLPVFAFAVLPAMTALMLTDRLRWALPLASLLGVLAGSLGYLFGTMYALPVGATEAALAVLFFLLALPIRLFARARAPVVA